MEIGHGGGSAELIDQSETTDLKKRRYFADLAMRYLPQMRLDLRGGGLWKSDGWRNVLEHCLVQTASSEVLADLLKLDDETKKRIAVTAACHDWDKRLDVELAKEKITPEERSEIEAEAERFFQAAGPDAILLKSTGPEHYSKSIMHPQEVSLAEKIQDYVDNIHRGDNIVPFKERIDEVEERNPHVGDYLEQDDRLDGLTFWQAVRKIGGEEEKEIFDRLIANGVEVDNPDDVPMLIKAEIEKRIESS